MDIRIRISFGEGVAVSLLNWLARLNARILLSRPDLPSLYDSGVRYEREEIETWCDYLQLLAQRWEDCDALAAARAGELIARGAAALRPGEGGYRRARALRLTSIVAEVVLTTHVLPGEHGQYHCIVRYEVDGQVFWDDPSARLGMLDRRLSPEETAERLRRRVELDGVLRPRRRRARPHSRRPSRPRGARHARRTRP